MLIGGLINEFFLRVPLLEQFSPFLDSDGVIFGMIHTVVMLIFVVLWAKFLSRTTRLFK